MKAGNRVCHGQMEDFYKLSVANHDKVELGNDFFLLSLLKGISIGSFISLTLG